MKQPASLERTRRPLGIGPIAAAACLAGALAWVIGWVDPPPQASFVAGWASHLRTPLVPDNICAENDRDALAAAAFFGINTFGSDRNLSADQFQAELERDQHRDSPRVIYLSGYATRDGDDDIALMTKEFRPTRGSGGLKFSSLLNHVDRSERPTLLVLDFSWSEADGPSGLLPSDVGEEVYAQLEQREAKNCLTLVGCSPGEVAAYVPGTGRTALGYFFEAGLMGSADGCNLSGVTDGRVSVRELADYVCRHVGEWTRLYAAETQHPQLIADNDADFLLSVSRRRNQRPPSKLALAAYPATLKQAWETRDNLVANGARSRAPRLVRRLESELIDTERRWRHGLELERVEALLKRHVPQLLRDILRVQEGVRTRLRLSLGSEVEAAEGVGDGPGVAWAALLSTAQELPSEGDEPSGLAAALVVFRKQTADVSCDTLALSGIDTLLQTPGAFQRLAPVVLAEVQRRSQGHQRLEVADLAALVGLAQSAPEATSPLLVGLLKTSLVREQAWADPLLTAWTDDLLREADGANRRAWAAATLPGYASSAAVRAADLRARELYRQALELQQDVRRAVEARDLAMAALPSLLPVIRLHPELQPGWCKASRVTVELADYLDPLPKDRRGHVDTSVLPEVASLTAELNVQLSSLLGPAQPESTEELCESLEDGRWADFTVVEALLSTPLLTAFQRESLCSAVNAASESLAPALQEFVGKRIKGSQSGDLEPPDSTGVERSELKIAHREAVFTSHLLSVIGSPSKQLDAAAAIASTRGQLRGKHALLRSVRQALVDVRDHLEADCPLAVRERASRVLTPAGFVPSLDASSARPAALATRARIDAWRQSNSRRLAAYAANVGGVEFASIAAKRLGHDASSVLNALSASCDSLGQRHQKRFALAGLSERDPFEELVLWIEHDTDLDLQSTVVQPARGLTVTQQLERQASGSKLTLGLRVSPNASFADLAATKGVLLCLSDGRNSRHIPIATPSLCTASPVEVLTEVAGVREVLRDSYEAPPASKPRSVNWIVRNRTNREIAVDVSLRAGASFTASAVLPPLDESLLQLAAAADAGMAGVAKDVNRVEVSVVDSRSGEQIYRRESSLSVRDPSQYVRVLDARVAPDESGATTAVLRVERLPGSPEQVEVKWSLSNPAAESGILLGGKLHGVLTPGSPTSTLKASLGPDWSDQPKVLTELAINGVQRSIVRLAKRPAFGAAAPLEVAAPTILLTAPRMVASGEPLRFAADAAPVPDGATLQVDLGIPGSDGSIATERRVRYDSARKRVVTVAKKPTSGGLMMQPTITAQDGEMNTTGMVGRRVLRATVLSGDGDKIAQSIQAVVIDGDPPSSVSITHHADAVEGKPLKISVAAVDDLSGVQKVALFVGAPIDGQAPKGAAVVSAVVDPARAGVWVATLPMPAGVPVVEVTAQAVNGVGMVSNRCVQVRLKSPEQASLGQVAGSVTEGARPQPGLSVELRDPTQNPVASASTNAQGRFLFTGVKPGKYLVWSVKEQSQRVGATGVEVKAGATATAKLELSL